MSSVDVSGGSTGLTTSGGPITSTGTITIAGVLNAASGGTGQSSYAVGDILYASSSTALSKLADIATGNVLLSGGVATAPSWGKVALGSAVSGTLPAGNGGTGVASLGDITKADDTNVTLTLGGTPTGAVITSTSFTLGWSGTLSVARGGSGAATLTGYLKGNGTSAFTASATIPASDIGSGAALTKGDDTNVTLTLGGTPTTALLAAASITAGWTGTLGVARGGTNIASYTVGDILYASGTTTLSALADAATGNALISGGVGVAPSYGKIGLTTHVSGILPTANGGTGIAYFTAAGPTTARVYTFPDAACTVLTTNAAVTVAQGGTGVATLAAHGVVIGNGTSAVAVTGAGTSGQVLTSNGASADPTFQAAPSPAWTQIGSTINTTSGTSATFSSIPATYQDLLLQYIGVGHNVAASTPFLLELSDNGSNWTATQQIPSATQTDTATIYGSIFIPGYLKESGEYVYALSNLTADRTVTGGSGGATVAWRIAAGIAAIRVSIASGGGNAFDAGSLKLFGK